MNALALFLACVICLTAVDGFSPAAAAGTRLVMKLPSSGLAQAKASPVVSRPSFALQSSVAAADGKKSGLWNAYLKTTDTLTTLFPLWTVLFAGLALFRPQSFDWFTTKYFTASLGE
jgi:hypothetical protein